MSKWCKRCFKELNDGAKYCEHCGKSQEGSKIGNFLKKIFISSEDFDSLITFVSISLLWCFIIFGACFVGNIFLKWSEWVLMGYRGVYNFIGAVLIGIYCIRCCSEIFKLWHKATKKTEEGKESRALLISLFSGFMTFLFYSRIFSTQSIVKKQHKHNFI